MAPPDPHLFLARPLKLEGGLSEIGGNEISQEGEKKRESLAEPRFGATCRTPQFLRYVPYTSPPPKRKRNEWTEIREAGRETPPCRSAYCYSLSLCVRGEFYTCTKKAVANYADETLAEAKRRRSLSSFKTKGHLLSWLFFFDMCDASLVFV